MAETKRENTTATVTVTAAHDEISMSKHPKYNTHTPLATKGSYLLLVKAADKTLCVPRDDKQYKSGLVYFVYFLCFVIVLFQ